MSVYRDTNPTVVFTHPFPGPLTATVYRDGDTTTPLATFTGLLPDPSGNYQVQLTYRQTQYDGRLRIDWTGTESDLTAFARSTYVDVVTSLLSPAQQAEPWTRDGQAAPPADELAMLENTVRAVIEAYCRQSFGYAVGTKALQGTGYKKIALPQRLASLTSYQAIDPNGNVGPGWPGSIVISNDGWNLILAPDTTLTVKESPPIEFMNYVSNGVIQVPDSYIKSFVSGTVYNVTGVWGYEVVPSEVQEAAILLMNDFATNDVGYRDRYLSSVKIQQDTVIYHPGAFRGTGNARADLLLAKWRRTGMVII